jgi:hypothetical protein
MLGRVFRRACCAALAAFALTATADASATTLVLDDGSAGPQPYQGWVDAALVPTPPGTVTLRLAGCPQPEFVTCEERHERTLDLDPGWVSRPVLLHELGHVFDDAMPAWARERFAALTHRRDPWEGPVNPPSEWFAEAYALCARHPVIRERYYAAYGYAPTPRRHRRICNLISRAGSAAP